MPNAQIIIYGDFDHLSDKYAAISKALADCLVPSAIDLISIVSCPKNEVALKKAVSQVFQSKPDLLIVAGGTGLGENNCTPQVISQCADYEIPGFGEIIRQKSANYSANAYLGRGGAWVKDKILILVLAGNKQAVRQQYDALGDLITEAIKSLNNRCANRRPIAKGGF